MPNLTDKDRAFLDENFKRFGTAWREGLAGLERDFEVEPQVSGEGYELWLTTRATPRVHYTQNVNKEHGGMYDNGPQLPQGPELEGDELSWLDGIFRALGELWMLEPLNNVCQIYDLSRGVAGLKGDQTMATRRLDGLAVLYFSDEQLATDYFCVSVDLLTGEIVEAPWVDLPLDPGRLLTAQECDFLDCGLRENGDFGVYGDVTQGLRALVTGYETRIGVNQDFNRFYVEPVDGYGHWLVFDMDSTTGEISNSAAGHFEPEPDDDSDDFDGI